MQNQRVSLERLGCGFCGSLSVGYEWGTPKKRTYCKRDHQEPPGKPQGQANWTWNFSAGLMLVGRKDQKKEANHVFGPLAVDYWKAEAQIPSIRFGRLSF